MENCNHEEHNSHNMIFMWKLVRKYLTVISNNHFFMINFLIFFWGKKKGSCVWQSLSHAPRYSWISSWVPPARTGARKLWTHTHPRLYWFLGLLKIAIIVLVTTQIWDVVKSQQSRISCTTPTCGYYYFFWEWRIAKPRRIWFTSHDIMLN